LLPLEIKFLFNNINEPTPKIKIGNVIFFGYQSKESFYDKFPLVLVLSIRKRNGENNIFGLNLHYIPVDFRLLILDIMRVTQGNLEKTTKLSNQHIPRRFLLNAIKSYNINNIATNIKVFKDNEINKIINTIVPDYGAKKETEIIKYLDKVFVVKKETK